MDHDTLSAIQDLATKIGSAVTHVAPQAWAIYVQVAQYTAIAKIATAVALLLTGLIAGIIGYKKGKAANYDCSSYGGDFPTFYALSAIGWVLATISFIVLLCDPWWFITAFAPQLGAAHDIVSAVLNAASSHSH